MTAPATTHPRLLARPDGWHLAPEGAAVHPEVQTAVIADVHLGYEWARGRAGDSLPAHSLPETLAKLDGLLSHVTLKRLIVAGDLVESPSPCARTAADVQHLTRWLTDRGVELVPLAGNHDPPRLPPLPDSIEVAGWTIAHGHHPLRAPRTITGHHHPALRTSGAGAPCFLVGPRTIVLPAFSPNAAGWNVASGPCPHRWRAQSLRCVAPAGSAWLDFGPLHSLARRLSGA
ncbi:MAG: metallophosphoesterase [Isosphaeraceae bacterium]|nr:metallophosphoesterase [Isosphaeraceae bacterium]